MGSTPHPARLDSLGPMNWLASARHALADARGRATQALQGVGDVLTRDAAGIPAFRQPSLASFPGEVASPDALDRVLPGRGTLRIGYLTESTVAGARLGWPGAVGFVGEGAGHLLVFGRRPGAATRVTRGVHAAAELVVDLVDDVGLTGTRAVHRVVELRDGAGRVLLTSAPAEHGGRSLSVADGTVIGRSAGGTAGAPVALVGAGPAEGLAVAVDPLPQLWEADVADQAGREVRFGETTLLRLHWPEKATHTRFLDVLDAEQPTLQRALAWGGLLSWFSLG